MPIPLPPGNPKPTHSMLGELLFAFLGITAFAVVAQSSEKLGKVLLALMLGFLVLWFVIHGQSFASFLQRIQNIGG